MRKISLLIPLVLLLLIGAFLIFIMFCNNAPQEFLMLAMPTIMGGVGLILLVVWIWALVDLLTKKEFEANDKIVWVLVIVFANWIGAIIYFLVNPGRRKTHY